jgi:hypothetical protein
MVKPTSIVASIALFLAGWMAPSAAQLNGVFVGNQSNVCVSSAMGFDANLALLGPASIVSSSLISVLTLRPDGTGTTAVRSLSVGHAATAAGATPATFGQSTCELAYTYDAASGVVEIAFAPCPGQSLSGPGAGQQSEQSGIVQKLLLVDGGTVLVSAGTRPTVETFRNLATGFTNQRICHRTGTRILRGPANPG